MTFLPIAIIAYALNGFSLIIDKSLVDHTIKSPFVYSFYIGVLSALAILLIPFGFKEATSAGIIYSSLSGLAFVIATIFFFYSLRRFDVTVASPIIGTLNPVFALLIGTLFLNEILTHNQYTAIGLLLLGGAALTFNLWWGRHLLTPQFLRLIATGLFFGLAYVLLREAFKYEGFIDVIIINRLTMTACALVFLLYPKIRHQIFSSKITSHHFINKTSYLVLLSQLSGAVSGLMLAFAVSLASPAVVNSIHGVQYIILLVAAILLAKNYPHILDERVNKKTLIPKFIATILIIYGLSFLAK